MVVQTKNKTSILDDEIPEKQSHRVPPQFLQETLQKQPQIPQMPSQALHLEEISSHQLDFKKNNQSAHLQINGQRLSGTLVQDPKMEVKNQENIKQSELMILGVEPSSNEGDCKVEQVLCLRYSFFKTLMGILAILCTCFIFLIILQRNNQLYRYFFFTLCTVHEASHFLTLNFDKTSLLQKKKLVTNLRGTEKIGFVNRYMTYLYSETSNKFRTLDLEIDRLYNNEILAQKPLSQVEVQKRRKLFGECIIEFELEGFLSFLYTFMSSPFFVLWWLSIIVWILQNIAAFSVVMTVVTLICIVILYIYSRNSRQQILKRAKRVIPVFRNTDQNAIEQIDSNLLVPGDHIRIQPQTNLPCDVILIQGEAFVNESNITGESDPVPKVQLENSDHTFHYYDHSQCVIYEGTQIINSMSPQSKFSEMNLQNSVANDYALGLVIRTGFSSKKGQVIRKSLYPNLDMQEFLISLVKFCSFWIFLSFICFAINAHWLFSDHHIPTDAAWLKLFEGIIDFGAAVLIVSNTASLIAGSARLQLKKIQALNYNLVANAGEIQIICFDKTGTLTENQVQATGYWSKMTQEFQDSKALQQKFLQGGNFEAKDELIQKLFATCHSVQKNHNNNKTNNNSNNNKESQDDCEYLGDIIDVQSFQMSNYSFVDSEIVNGKQALLTVNCKQNQNCTLSVLKRYDFKSEHASMSVIVKDGDDGFKVFIKGSPEKLKGLCDQSSIPQNFDEIYNSYSIQGYRVLGLAYRPFVLENESQLQRIQRDQVDKNLVFLGFLVLENPLKDDSQQVFQRIRDSELPMKIISGDGNLTVTHTAQELGMFNHWQSIYHIDIDQNTKKLKITVQNDKELKEKQFKNEECVKEYLKNVVSHSDNQISIKGKAIEYLRNYREIQLSGKKYNKNTQEWIDIYQKLILYAKCMSRCTPIHKKYIIEELRSQKIKTAMVGDGANDCLAIQAANVGISFAAADASLSSDFCTDNTSIDCVEKIICEGRSIMNINYECSHLYLFVVYLRYVMHMIEVYYYQIPNSLQNIMPAYFGGYIFVMIFWSRTNPVTRLNKYVQQTSISSLRSILSLTGRWGIALIVMVIFHFNLKSQYFYHEPEIEDKRQLNFSGELNTVYFYLTNLWIQLMPFILYIGKPVKEPFYKNKFAIGISFWNVLWGISIYFLKETTFEGLNLIKLSNGYKLALLVSCLGSFGVMALWEKFVVNRIARYETKKAIYQSKGMSFEDKGV